MDLGADGYRAMPTPCPEAPRRGGVPASVVPYVPCTVWYTTGTGTAALTLTLTTGTAAASSVVRDVLELEASALRARNPSPAASAQLEDVFGNRPKH
eukprot:scaffold68415_cov60-Phaeocystis_antarctica.AAC.1